MELFDAVEREHPYSTWATYARLMSAYAEYSRNRYTEALGQLDRFIQLHPAHRDIAYAYYLRALCYYEQIDDAQRDQAGTQTAMAALQDVVNRFPNSPYARDARLKMDLARDHLAGKEMNIGRFYQQRRLYAAAIGRFRKRGGGLPNHQPRARGAAPADRDLPGDGTDRGGAEDGLRARATTIPAAPGTRTATRMLVEGAPLRA